MARTIKVGVVFDFYPDGEHSELFEGMTHAEIVRYSTEMAYDDIVRFASHGTLDLSVEVLDGGDD